MRIEWPGRVSRETMPFLTALSRAGRRDFQWLIGDDMEYFT